MDCGHGGCDMACSPTQEQRPRMVVRGRNDRCRWGIGRAVCHTVSARLGHNASKGTGVVSNLVMSASEVGYEPPTFSGETAEYFKQRAAALNLHAASNSQHPDIIVLLQESTVDPRLYSVPDPKMMPSLTMFEHGGNVKAHTPMRVQTFGGGTWLSEFALLTGLRSDDFGAMKNSVFYSAVDHVNDSLFKQKTMVITPSCLHHLINQPITRAMLTTRWELTKSFSHKNWDIPVSLRITFGTSAPPTC